MDVPQCVVEIFLPLWFYVKSILADFRRSKTAVFISLKALNFDFWKILFLKTSKVSKNSKFRAARMVKRVEQFMGLLNDQNWFHVKSVWQHNLELLNFSAIQIFMWNQSWSFWSLLKNCYFDLLNSSEFYIFGSFLHFQVWNFPKVKIQSLQNCYSGSFWPSEVSQNWFHVKSE